MKNDEVEELLTPTITVPSFLTLDWVAANIGNIQPSDIRHISSRCRGLIAGWPTGKVGHATFVEQIQGH